MYISTKLEKALIVHTARCGAPNKTEVITPRFVPETKLWRGTSHGRGPGRGMHVRDRETWSTSALSMSFSGRTGRGPLPAGALRMQLLL